MHSLELPANRRSGQAGCLGCGRQGPAARGDPRQQDDITIHANLPKEITSMPSLLLLT